MNRLHWQLQHCAVAVGWPGWLGMVLLLACISGWTLVANPLKVDTQQLDAARLGLEKRLGAVDKAAALLPLTPQQQLAEFQRRFTGEDRIAASIAQLQAAAKRHGMALDQAEFRLVNDAKEPLLRYAIVLPVTAEYRLIRSFIRQALLELPGLAIEEVNLARRDPTVVAIDAQLRFVLFVSKADPGQDQ